MKRCLALFFGLLLLVAGAAEAFAGGKGATRRYALLVAANDGGQERPKLRYAATDAKALGDVLVEMGGVRRSDQMLVVEPDPSELSEAVAEMEKKLAKADASGQRTELLFYYSGHSDASGLLLGDKRVTYRKLRQQLDGVPADVRLIILDSCASGALTRTKGGQRVPAFLSDEANEVKGHAILTSSSQDEAAQESDAIKASFFTYFLVSGLRGAADISGDRRVTLNEAYRYAFDETLARTQRTRGGAQHAEYDIQMTGHGDLVLTELQRTNAVLSVGKKVAGRLWVSKKNRLVAEVTKHGGRALELGLPSGTYRVQLAANDKVYATDVKLRAGKKAELASSSFDVVGTEDTVLRGGMPTVSQPEPVVVGFDLVPMLGTSSFATDAPRLFSLNLAGGMSGGSRILEIAGGFNLDNGPVTGVQIAGALNLDQDTVAGVQLAGGANINRGHTSGLQFAGGLNIVGGLSGMQAAGGLNLALGETSGVQAAPANYARQLNGVQLGVLNISESHASGLQLGVINIAPTADAGVGLLGIYWDGFVQPEALGTSDGLMMSGVRHGGGPFYNVYYVGSRALAEDGGPLAYGLGFGWHTALSARFEFAADLGIYNVLGERGDWTTNFNLFKLRPMLSFELFDDISAFGGPTATLMVASDDSLAQTEDFAPFGAWELTAEESSSRVSLWPGFVAGARFF